MLRPSSANVFNSDYLFKALGLLCQINGYAIVFNVSTLFGSEVSRTAQIFFWGRDTALYKKLVTFTFLTEHPR